MSKDESIEIGLGNYYGELFVVKRNNKFYLVLTDNVEDQYVPIGEETYRALRAEFIYNELVK